MSSTDPNLGLNYGWTLGESGWDTGMDANLKRLGAVLHVVARTRKLLIRRDAVEAVRAWRAQRRG